MDQLQRQTCPKVKLQCQTESVTYLFTLLAELNNLPTVFKKTDINKNNEVSD